MMLVYQVALFINTKESVMR